MVDHYSFIVHIGFSLFEYNINLRRVQIEDGLPCYNIFCNANLF